MKPETNYPPNSSMTPRDYFAAAALNGICVNAKANHENALPELAKTLANISYIIADAMLAEREKKQP